MSATETSATSSTSTSTSTSTSHSARCALVTGATRGIGASLVRQLTSQGIRVYATGRDDVALQKLKQETGCLGSVFDLSQSSDVLSCYKSACQELGTTPDILINNAGFNSRKAAIAETNLEEWEAQHAVNLRAPYILCREGLRDMIVKKSGYIINVISSCALYSNETMGIYTTMKAGLKGLTGVLIKEARPHGIKVTGVYPGGVDTPFRAIARPDYMTADSCAHMIVQLLSSPADVFVHELTFRPQCETNFP